MIVGCYSMDLYCDTGGDTIGNACPHHSSKGGAQAEFMGRIERECLQSARAVGWTFKRGGRAYCPGCSKDQRKGGQ